MKRGGEGSKRGGEGLYTGGPATPGCYAGEGRGTLMWVITAKPSIPEQKRGGEGWYRGGPATPGY